MNPSVVTDRVLSEVLAERIRQDQKWGEQNHPDGTGNKSQQDYAEQARRWCQAAFGSGYGTWADVLAEEVAEANAEREPAKLRAELIQVAAVAVAWVEALDRRTAQPAAKCLACQTSDGPCERMPSCQGDGPDSQRVFRRIP
ncbi:hypothetical protein [Streptomyces sp. NPDC001635]